MERVVVTGMGLVTPCGIGTDATLSALMQGQSGVGPITQFDANEEYATRFAAEVRNFDATEFVSKKRLKEMSRFTTFALAAASMAFEDSQPGLSDEECERTVCFIGVGIGGLENLERVTLTCHGKG